MDCSGLQRPVGAVSASKHLRFPPLSCQPEAFHICRLQHKAKLVAAEPPHSSCYHGMFEHASLYPM